ncbi:ABC transporter substrate binding protein [Thiobacillus sp.]|uniref:ABC transporter substrate-binding protein n=1 Tax=Thiobacillus sp. TaxID=924 RepID=UPI0025FB5DCC|nr:ABC transporter substrate binding protein [Thiobacillus sp.]
MSSQAVAARVAVVLSDDATPYQEVYQVIRAYLDDTPHEAVRVYAEGLTPAALNDARLVVAVGVGAAEALAALPERPPVLAILVPRAWYLKTGRARLGSGNRRNLSAIYLDQPFERQALLIRLALPDVRRVGVLLSAEQSSVVNELDSALRAQGLSLVYATLTPDERLITPLEAVLTEADLLLALPDPLVFNRNTAQSLFLTSYRYRDPVLGYSRSLTRAGALLSLHSSPAQIGRQAAEWISSAMQGGTVRLPPPAYPSYFSVSINDQVARSLGFILPPEADLEKRLEGRN